MSRNQRNARRFLAQLQEEKEVPERLVSQTVRALGLQALAGIVNATPVDTGRARGNWQATFDRPADDFFLGKFDKSGQQAISQGSIKIDQHTGYRRVFITNNLPYILMLEDGSSKRAPDGMVAVTYERLSL